MIKLSYQTVSTSISKIFGDFRLVIDKSTGFFNATKLCDQGGKKQFRQWKILEKSKTKEAAVRILTAASFMKSNFKTMTILINRSPELMSPKNDFGVRKDQI